MLGWVCFCIQGFGANGDVVPKTGGARADSVHLKDSLAVRDSIAKQMAIKQKKAPFQSKVKYSASDSIRFDLSKQILYLYGKAEVIYEDLKMNAGYIELDMHQNTVYAKSRKDTAGKDIELPQFTEGAQVFNTHEMTYNFKTKKGLIIGVITKESDGYIHGETVKKDSTNTVFIQNGKYTTCDLEHPHFYIQAQKLKIIPDDKIITGPCYMVINGIPTPLVVPFGLFPNTKGRKSGLIIPTYGQSANQGFFLSNGGFYWGISDYLDAAITGDIYTRGSWGLKTHVNYVKKYKYTGGLDIKYAYFTMGDPMFKPGNGNPLYSNGVPLFNPSDPLTAYSLSNNFMVNWTHREDIKANPGSTFSATVNAGSSNYNTLTSTNPALYLNNTLSSNINYFKSFDGTPFNLSLAARHDQNTITKSINITLPEIDLLMNRIYPFKNVNDPVNHWYDKIGVSYSGQMMNTLSTNDTLWGTPRMFKQIVNGFHQNVPISTSFNIFKYFTVTPTFNYNGNAYMQSIREHYDPIKKVVVIDTVPGFAMENDYNFATAVSTKLYGNYIFGRKAYIKQIRHVITPNLNFTYHPDFTSPYFGYNKQIAGQPARDTLGNPLPQTYSKFQNSIYGPPPAGKADIVGFSLSNNLEAKIYDPKDSVHHEKKIVLIDRFILSSGYNMAVLQNQWQPLSIQATTKLFKVLDINFSEVLNPYAVDTRGNITPELQVNKNGELFWLSNYNLAFGANLRNLTNPSSGKDKLAAKNLNGYADFSVPWTLNMFLNFTYVNPGEGVGPVQRTQSLTFNGDFSPTKKWKIGFTSGYDINHSTLTYTQLNIYRDLHCWEMKVNWVPFGPRQMYMISINVKSALLKDLKLNRTRQWYDFQ